MRRRWLVLLLISFLMGCNYYCYDIPAALIKPLGSRIDNVEVVVDNMYAVYSIPNIFLPMAGGLLIDKVGLYFSLTLFSSLCLTGQLLVAVGCSVGSIELMLLSRFIFGLGGESISVAQSALVRKQPT